MSNEFTERTFESRYVIEVQIGHFNVSLKFAIFVQKRELCTSALFLRTGIKQTYL